MKKEYGYRYVQHRLKGNFSIKILIKLTIISSLLKSQVISFFFLEDNPRRV